MSEEPDPRSPAGERAGAAVMRCAESGFPRSSALGPDWPIGQIGLQIQLLNLPTAIDSPRLEPPGAGQLADISRGIIASKRSFLNRNVNATKGGSIVHGRILTHSSLGRDDNPTIRDLCPESRCAAGAGSSVPTCGQTGRSAKGGRA
jgi:hypothetical protein